MKELRKYFRIKGPAEEVYAALINPFSIALWTGAEASMKEEEGSEFSLFDGDISGKNLEFVQNQKIVQEWYFGDQQEQSLVTIKLFEDKKGTQVELIHTNIPDEDFENITEGWNKYYFGAIISFFEVE